DQLKIVRSKDIATARVEVRHELLAEMVPGHRFLGQSDLGLREVRIVQGGKVPRLPLIPLRVFRLPALEQLVEVVLTVRGSDKHGHAFNARKLGLDNQLPNLGAHERVFVHHDRRKTATSKVIRSIGAFYGHFATVNQGQYAGLFV